MSSEMLDLLSCFSQARNVQLQSLNTNHRGGSFVVLARTRALNNQFMNE